MSNVDLDNFFWNLDFLNVIRKDTEIKRREKWDSIFVPELAEYYKANWPDSTCVTCFTVPRCNGKTTWQMRLALDTIHKLSKLPPRIFLRRLNLTHEEKLFFYYRLGVRREYLEDEELY